MLCASVVLIALKLPSPQIHIPRVRSFPFAVPLVSEPLPTMTGLPLSRLAVETAVAEQDLFLRCPWRDRQRKRLAVEPSSLSDAACERQHQSKQASRDSTRMRTMVVVSSALGLGPVGWAGPMLVQDWPADQRASQNRIAHDDLRGASGRGDGRGQNCATASDGRRRSRSAARRRRPDRGA